MKKLLFSLAIAGISAVNFNAQSRVWDFNDTSKFPSTTAAMTATTVIEGLTFVPAGGSSFGIFNSQGATFADGYAPSQRVAVGGHSYGSSTYDPAAAANSPLPTQRFMSFPVSGDSTIKVWSRGGGSGRTVLVTDGTTILGRTDHAGNNSTADAKILTATYTGGAATLYVANAFNQNSIFKIEVIDNATMAVDGVKSGMKANAFSNGNKIYVSNPDAKALHILVYNANGSVVKSTKSASDINFEMNTKGLYIVNIKSESGEKSVKVLVK